MKIQIDQESFIQVTWWVNDLKLYSSLAAAAIFLIFRFLDKRRFESFGFGWASLIDFDHLKSDVGEELIDIFCSFCWGFHELDSVFFSWDRMKDTEGLTLLEGDCSFGAHIDFVSDEHACDFLIDVAWWRKKYLFI